MRALASQERLTFKRVPASLAAVTLVGLLSGCFPRGLMHAMYGAASCINVHHGARDEAAGGTNAIYQRASASTSVHQRASVIAGRFGGPR
jgi:hypothetical protein